MNNNFSKADWNEINGTSFHLGYIENSANEINEVLDNFDEGDYDKTSHEWCCKVNGIPFAVYDYKEISFPSNNSVIKYHIGTKTRKETFRVVAMLKEAGLNAYVL